MQFDALYYYIGGRDRGHWNRVLCTVPEIAAKQAELRAGGYVTRLGKLSVGAPEGCPRELRDPDFNKFGKGRV